MKIVVALSVWFGLGFMSCLVLDRYAMENQESYSYRVDK